VGLFGQKNSKKSAELIGRYQQQLRDRIAALPKQMANGLPTPMTELTRQCDIVSLWMGKTIIANGFRADTAETMSGSLRQNIDCIEAAYVEAQDPEDLAEFIYYVATRSDWLRAQLPEPELKPVLDAYFFIARVMLDSLSSTKVGKHAIGLSRWCATKEVEGDLGQPPIPLAGWYWDPEGSKRYRRSDGTNWTSDYSDEPEPA
jgi:hypothetical protein